MGKTCEPKAFSFQCMTELTTNKTTTTKKKVKKKKKSNNIEITSLKLKEKNQFHILYVVEYSSK